MNESYSLTIGWLYPDLMSTYGDRGNVIVLTKRCEWRGISVIVKEITLETTAEVIEECDLIFMGGAQDRQQTIVSKDFIGEKSKLVKEKVDNGTPALFVCAAYQFVGNFYRPYQGDDIAGAAILDLHTVHPGDQKKRLIGNVVAEIISIPELNGEMIVGFENHGGRTQLGKGLKPLAKVISGGGNNGEDGFEGVVYKNTIGSYFHGPLLPKNPKIADWLIKKSLDKKYYKSIELPELNDDIAEKAKSVLT